MAGKEKFANLRANGAGGRERSKCLAEGNIEGGVGRGRGWHGRKLRKRAGGDLPSPTAAMASAAD